MDRTKSLPFNRGNTKLGPNVLTWSRPYGLTCPTTCQLLDAGKPCGRHKEVVSTCPNCAKGCYADPTTRNWMVRQMDTAAKTRLGLRVPIDTLRRGQVLRLHVAGDFKAIDGHAADVDYIAGIRDGLAANSDASVFTYSHGWRQWPELTALRDTAGITINASCDTPDQVELASSTGWNVAYTGADVIDATYHHVGARRLLVCPQQRGKVATCEQCRVCWRPTARLAGVAFIAH